MITRSQGRRPPPRPAMTALGALAWVGLCLAGSPARAFDYRTIAAADLLVTSAPSEGAATTADLGVSLRADLLRLGSRVDVHFDFWGRAGLTGSPSVQQLRTLSATVRDLGGRLDLTVGRFHAPGGFWLIVDGVRLDLRYTDWLTHSVYGGLRAFTTARRNADLAFDSSAVLLPLAGTTLQLRTKVVDLGVGFTWSRDAIDLQNQLDTGTGLLRWDRKVEDELFLDAHALILPADRVFVAVGGSFGSRYDVRFTSGDPLAPAQLGVATLGALSAYGMVEYRPVKPLRLQYSVNFERVRLLQSQLAFVKLDGTPVAAAAGDFLDNRVRGTLLVWRALRVEAQYRLRYRANTDLEHHATVGLRGDDLWRGLGGFASVGLDVFAGPGVPATTTRVVYSGGLSYLRPGLDARVGILFTDGIGSGLLFSAPSTTASGAAPTELFPYLLESNRVAFVRVFGTWRDFFGGADVEVNVDRPQVRALAQLGFSR